MTYPYPGIPSAITVNGTSSTPLGPIQGLVRDETTLLGGRFYPEIEALVLIHIREGGGGSILVQSLVSIVARACSGADMQLQTQDLADDYFDGAGLRDILVTPREG